MLAAERELVGIVEGGGEMSLVSLLNEVSKRSSLGGNVIRQALTHLLYSGALTLDADRVVRLR